MPDLQSTVSTPAVFRGGTHARIEEIDYVLDFVDRSDKYRQNFVHIWDEVLANYLVAPMGGSGQSWLWSRQGTRLPYKNTGKRVASVLKDPETHQIIETITAMSIGMLLGGKENITVTPVGREDYEKARLLAKLLESVMDQPGVWRTHYQLIKDAYLFGIAILKIGWETRSRKQYVRRGSRLVIEDVVFRDRPLQRSIDHYNFYPDPTGTRIREDMVGVAEAFKITFREARRLAKPGPNGEPPVYDAADVEMAIAIREKQIAAARGRGPGRDARFPDLDPRLPSQMELMDGIEYFGESPVQTSDGMSNRVITLLNGVRVRSRGNMFIDGEFPYIEFLVNPISGRFYGLGLGEVLRFLQDSADNMLMSFNDAVNLALHAPLLVGQSWGGNDQELRERALNSLISCVDPKMVEPLQVDVNLFRFAGEESARRSQRMREASGATDTAQAIQGDATLRSATEANIMDKRATSRVEPTVLLIEKDAYPAIGRMLHSRLRQFLPDGGAVATLAGEAFEVPLEAVDIEADVRFTGTRQAGSKFQRAATYRTMAEVLGTDAGQRLALLYPEVLVRWFRDGAEIPDAEDIVKRASQRAMAMTALEQAGGGGAAGGAPPPSASREESFGTQAGETEREGEAIE